MLLTQAMVETGLVGCQSEARRLIVEGVIRIKPHDSAWIREVRDPNHCLSHGKWEIVVGRVYKVWEVC